MKLFKNILNTIEKSRVKFLTKIMSVTLFVSTSVTAFAAPTGATTDIDATINFIANWVGKFGLIIAFIGGVNTALAFKNDDADAKSKGIRTLVAGFMVFGITKSLSLFGL